MAAVLVTVNVVLAALLPSTASAATNTYLRLAQLAPDTPPVSVVLTSANGPGYRLDGMGYGKVSVRQKIVPGTYAVQVRPATEPSATPILTGSLLANQGGAYTVAVLGPPTGASVTVLTDELTDPGPGRARVRVVQASPLGGSVAVTWNSSVVTGPVAVGIATDYVTASAGRGTFTVTPTTGAPVTLVGSLADGGVYTVILLQGDGGLTGRVQIDALAPRATPGGTGGGPVTQYPDNVPPGADPTEFFVKIDKFEGWGDALQRLYNLCASDDAPDRDPEKCRTKAREFVRDTPVEVDENDDQIQNCESRWQPGATENAPGRLVTHSTECAEKLNDQASRDAALNNPPVVTTDNQPETQTPLLIQLVAPPIPASTTGIPSTGGSTATAGPTAGPTAQPATNDPGSPTAVPPTENPGPPPVTGGSGSGDSGGDSSATNSG